MAGIRTFYRNPVKAHIARSTEESLSSLACPLCFHWYGQSWTQSYGLHGLNSTQILGQVIQNVFPKPTNKVFIEWKVNKIGSLALLIIIWQTFDQAFETGAFTSVKPDNIIFIVFISITYYVLWTAICVSLSILWLGKEDTIAVAYCVPAKTPAMGVPLSHVMFPGIPALTESKIQIPMVIFQAFQIASGSLMTIVFRWWIRPHEERETDAAKAEP